jgi:hypothetical protein
LQRATRRQEDALVRVEVVVLERAQGDLRGKEAFDAVRARIGNDPIALATLPMLFLDDGVAGRKPWTQPSGDHARDQLIDLALNAHDPRERGAAVEVLGKTGGAGVVAALSWVLLYDRFDEVREAGRRRSAISAIRRRETRCRAPRAVTPVAGFRCWPPEALKKLK